MRLVMISTDEVNATIARLKIIANNTESTEERAMATMLMNNIQQLVEQFIQLQKSPQWSEVVKQFEPIPVEETEKDPE